MSASLQTVLDCIERDRTSEIDFLRALIAAQREGEDTVQSLVATRLESFGAKVERIVYTPADVKLIGEFAASQAIAEGDRASIVGQLTGSGAGRSLILFAHPDSEPVRAPETWQHDAFSGVIENGRLHGWGVSDDLAGVAAGVCAMQAVAESGVTPGGAVIMASTPSKRHARGVAAMMQQGFVADAAVYLHPAESGVGLNEIKAFASGQLEFRVTVAGQKPPTSEPGHTAFAHMAINPVDKAFVIYQALMALNAERGATVHHAALHKAVGRSTNLQISNMRCGEDSKFSRLHLSASLGAAISFPPNEKMEDVQAQIESAIANAAAADPWLCSHRPVIEWISGVTGMEIGDDHELYRTVADAVTAIAGIVPKVNPMHTSSDIRNPIVQKGIPTVGLGPFCGNLTQVGLTDEWVDIEDYIRMIKVTASVIFNWTQAN